VVSEAEEAEALVEAVPQGDGEKTADSYQQLAVSLKTTTKTL
jgi:hypothetical protein